MNKLDLIDIYRMRHPAKIEFAFITVHMEDAHGRFTKRNYLPGPEESSCRFQDQNCLECFLTTMELN